MKIPALARLAPLFAAFGVSVPAWAGVYCDSYQNGYSIYRASDGRDIGSGYFYDGGQCGQAADLANRVDQDIVCSPYNNQGTEQWSAYRVSDGRDLGGGTFLDFDTCQRAVRYAHGGIVCLAYRAGEFSPYDIGSGRDLGQTEYRTLDGCLNAI